MQAAFGPNGDGRIWNRRLGSRLCKEQVVCYSSRDCAPAFLSVSLKEGIPLIEGMLIKGFGKSPMCRA